MDPLTINITGLKCDNPNCDYRRDDIPFEAYEGYINAPCPKCGESLLTQADYDECLRMKSAARKVSAIVEATKWVKPSHYWNMLFGKS